MGEEKGVIYCEWCGEFPYYISIYEDVDSGEETLLCKKCYNEMDDDNQ